MKLSCVRLSVRWLMATIGSMAVVLGVGIEVVRLKKTRDRYLAKAAEFAEAEETSLGLTSWYEASVRVLEGTYTGDSTFLSEAADRRADLAEAAADLEYHSAMRWKYLRAAARPWRHVETDPPPPTPHAQARYWARRGDFARAAEAYREELRIRPDPEPDSGHDGLARLLATCPDSKIRDGTKAVELCYCICEWTSFRHAPYLDTLAAAYAEAGNFKAAVETQREAVLRQEQDDQKGGYGARLKLYEAGKPYRDEAPSSK
jgi:tetratricopeptide (TPR) repeat protein